MRHIHAGIAVLAATAGMQAMAQSVTLFGIVDTNIARGVGAVASRTFMGHSGNSSSRVGFRGVEDLGNGLSASFWMEAGVNSDDGRGAPSNSNNQASGVVASQGLTFNRRSTLSIASRSWGEIRMGRDYTPTFWTYGVFDPFGLNGVGTTHVLNGSVAAAVPVVSRASNAIAYHYNSTSPTGNSGLYGSVQYFLGENSSSAAGSKDGTGYAWRAGYETRQFNVSASAGRTQYSTGDYQTRGAGISYTFDIARVMAQYSSDEVNAAARRRGHGYLVGLAAPLGAGELRASYSVYQRSTTGDPKSAKIAVGYVHALSKRTALYATVAQIRNTGGASDALNGATGAPNATSRGYDVGLRHAF